MARVWNTVRVFISSTFRDMQAERDHLVKVVFPALRERLDAHRIHLIDVDLRWGVTREEIESAGAVGACLSQLDECRPFFVGILGERYGWIPNSIAPETVALHRWLADYRGRSLTEIEIVHGVLRDSGARRRAFFCFRDSAALSSIPLDLRRTVYSEADERIADQLVKLKRDIRASGFPILDGYPAQWDTNAVDASTGTRGRLTGLELFGQRVHDQVLAMISAELDRPDIGDVVLLPTLDPIEEERDLQERFIESHLRLLAGRDDVHAQLLAYSTGREPGPCVLGGAVGSGKSATLARLVSDLRVRYPEMMVLANFSAASARAATLRDVLARLCRDLLLCRLNVEKQARLDAERNSDLPGLKSTEIENTYAIPDRLDLVAATFARFLRMLPADTPLVVVLDLGEASADHADVTRLWLPDPLPAHVRLILTADDRTQGIVSARPHTAIALMPLSDDERRAIIELVPSLSAKRLDAKQTKLLLKKPATASPLFLRVALEELRGFGSYEQLTDRIRALPDGAVPGLAMRVLTRLHLVRAVPSGDPIDELFDQVLDRLENEFDPTVARLVLNALSAARRGLSERELRELVAGRRREDDLFPVLRQLRPYLVSRAGLLSFQYRALGLAVRRRYLADDNESRESHRMLAEFFDGQPFRLAEERPNVRKVDELVWQRCAAGQADAALTLLNDIRYVEAKIDSQLILDLASEYRDASIDAGVDADLCGHLAGALERSSSWLERHPEAAFQCLWNFGSWYDNPAAAGHYVDPAAARDEPGRFAALLERWRDDPNRIHTRCWIRSLRPDNDGLGTAPVLAHGDPITAVAVSQNGSLIATAGGHSVKVWDARGRWLRDIFYSPEPVSAVDLFGPPAELDQMSLVQARQFWDGLGPGALINRVAYAAGGVVHVARLISGEEISRFTHTSSAMPVRTAYVAFSPTGPDGGMSGLVRYRDGHWIASVWGSHVSLWDAQSGELLRELKEFGMVDDVRWTPDGTRVIVSGLERSDDPERLGEPGVRLWNAKTGEVVLHERGCERLVYSRDGQRIILIFLSAGSRMVAVYSTKDGALAHQHQLPIDLEKCAVSWDGRHIASVTYDSAVHVWDLDSGTETASYRPPGSTVNALTFLSTGHRLMVGLADGTVRLWSRHGGARDLVGHYGDIQCVRFSDDGALVATGGNDGFVRLWRSADGTPAGVLVHDDRIDSLALSPGAERIAVMSGLACRIYSTATTEPVAKFALPIEPKARSAVSYSPDGATVVVSIRGTHGYRIVVFDVATGGERWSADTVEDEESICTDATIAFSPDGQRVLSGGIWCKTLRMWNTETGDALAAYMFGVEDEAVGCDAIGWSPDSRHIATVCAILGSTTLRDAETLRPAGILHAQTDPSVYADLAGARAFLLARGALDEHATVQSVKTGRVVARFPKKLRLIAAHPDGRTFAAALGPHLYILTVEGEETDAR